MKIYINFVGKVLVEKFFEICYIKYIKKKKEERYMGYYSDKNNGKRTWTFRRRAHYKANRKRLKVMNYGFKPSRGSDGGGYWKGRKNSDTQRFLKKISNRKVRRSKDIGQYGQYKKRFDYWYEWF